MTLIPLNAAPKMGELSIVFAGGVEQAHQIAHYPIRSRAAVAAGFGGDLEVIASGARQAQHLRIVFA